MTDVREAWATDRVLLTFDGSVLEIFGFTDTHRRHIAYRPVIEFPDGRRARLRVSDDIGPYSTFDYDPARREALEVFAAHLKASHRPR